MTLFTTSPSSSPSSSPLPLSSSSFFLPLPLLPSPPQFGGDQHLIANQLPLLEGKEIKVLPPETSLMPFECNCRFDEMRGEERGKNLSAVTAVHFTWGTKPWLLEKRFATILHNTKCIREIIRIRRKVMSLAAKYCEEEEDDPLCSPYDTTKYYRNNELM